MKLRQVLAASFSLLPPGFEIDIALRGNPKWFYGVGVQGDGIVTIPVSHGKARVDVLKRYEEDGGVLAKALEDLDDAVGLIDFLRPLALQRGGRRVCMSLLKQLAWPHVCVCVCVSEGCHTNRPACGGGSAAFLVRHLRPKTQGAGVI